MAGKLRPADEYVSTLPRFESKVSQDFPEFLIVWCPRDDCPGTMNGRPFLVHAETWTTPDVITRISDGREFTITGRSCPYCFRSARLPASGTITRNRRGRRQR